MRYMLFGGNTYYAAGGANDLIDRFEHLHAAQGEAHRAMRQDEIEWWHVYDTVEKRIVDESQTSPQR